MEGYYQYCIAIDEGDAIRTYSGVVYSEDGYTSAVDRVCEWYQNYGSQQSITLEMIEEGAVFDETVKEDAK